MVQFVDMAAQQARIKTSLDTRMAAVLAYPSLRRLQTKIDPRRVNVGVFLGLNGTVIKSHGAADATGVAAAIRLAHQLAQLRFTEKLAARVASGLQNSQDDDESEEAATTKTTSANPEE